MYTAFENNTAIVQPAYSTLYTPRVANSSCERRSFLCLLEYCICIYITSSLAISYLRCSWSSHFAAMFAPDATVRSAVSSLRNPRRRQRTNSDDSVKLPKAKRQRSALGEDTFEPHPFTASEQESSVDADPNAYKAGFVVQKDLALRGPKRPEKRSDADGIVILVRKSFQRSLLKRVKWFGI